MAPNIFNYNDPTEYLSAYLKWLKEQDSDFSIRKWSAQYDIKADTLTDVLKQKKKISASFSSQILTALDLEQTEKTYFEALVKFSNAANLDEKRMFSLVLSELVGLQGSRIKVEDETVFSHWAYVTILVLSELPYFDCNAGSVAQILKTKVSQETIEKGFQVLLANGLIQEAAPNSYKRVFDHATTKNDTVKTTVHKYYEQIFDLAKENIRTSVDEREFQCFSLAIEHDQIPVFKEAIRNFRAKVSAIPMKNADQVYQMNIQFFPLSEVATNDKFQVESKKENHQSI